MSDVPPPAPQQPTAPAGWYPDPQSPLAQRWWDGSTWTEHTAPMGPRVAPQPSGRGSLFNGKRDIAAGRNTAAVQSLWVGIVSVVLAAVGIPWLVAISALGGLAAIVWGSIAMTRANANGKGRGVATAGLALGVVGLLVAIFRLLAL